MALEPRVRGHRHDPVRVATNLEAVAFSLMGMSLFLRTSMPSPRGKVHDPEDMAENLRCMAHERWDMASPSKGSTPSGLGMAATDSTLAPSFGSFSPFPCSRRHGSAGWRGTSLPRSHGYAL